MVSPVGEDATEESQSAASALEAQALVEEEVPPADQDQVLNKVRSRCSPWLQEGVIYGPRTYPCVWLGSDLQSATSTDSLCSR